MKTSFFHPVLISIGGFFILMGCTPNKSGIEKAFSNDKKLGLNNVELNNMEPASSPNLDLKQLANKAFCLSDPIQYDLLTGERYGFLYSDDMLKNKENIRVVNIIEYHSGNFEPELDSIYFKVPTLRETYKFDNGCIIFTHSVFNPSPPDDDYYSYKYDEQNRLKSSAGLFFIYPPESINNEYKRDVYAGKKFLRTEIISLIPDGYKIFELSYTNSQEETHFIIEDGLLREVKVLDEDGKEREWYLYEYDENNLVKRIIKSIKEKSNIYQEQAVLERDEEKIIRLDVKFYPSSNGIIQYYFKEYDDFNNWTIKECYIDGILFNQVKREIEYSD
jgi:hypothetical protein